MTEKRTRWLLLPACAAVAALAHFAVMRGEADVSIDDDIAMHLEDAIICDDGDGRTELTLETSVTEMTLETSETGASRLPDNYSNVDDSI